MKNNYTIGQIQDLTDFMNWNVKHGYMDENIAEDIMESGDWVEASRLRDLADSLQDEYIRQEPVSDAPEWVTSK
jgi:hypothetical protein